MTHNCTNIVAVIQVARRNEKTYLTNSASPLIMKVKLFIYLRNLCSGLMTKKLNVSGVNHA